MKSSPQQQEFSVANRIKKSSASVSSTCLTDVKNFFNSLLPITPTFYKVKCLNTHLSTHIICSWHCVGTTAPFDKGRILSTVSSDFVLTIFVINSWWVYKILINGLPHTFFFIMRHVMLNDSLAILVFPLTLIELMKFVLEGNIWFLFWRKGDSREAVCFVWQLHKIFDSCSPW